MNTLQYILSISGAVVVIFVAGMMVMSWLVANKVARLEEALRKYGRHDEPIAKGD